MSAPASGLPAATPPAGSTLPDRHRNGALGVIVVPERAEEAAAPTARPAARPARYRVSMREYITFREQGFLVVRGLVAPAEVEELRASTEDLIWGRVAVPGLEPPPGASVEEIERRYLRIHRNDPRRHQH
jgi:hypothetical protein